MLEIFVYEGHLIQLSYLKHEGYYHATVFREGKKYDWCQSENRAYCMEKAKEIVEFSIESQDYERTD